MKKENKLLYKYSRANVKKLLAGLRVIKYIKVVDLCMSAVELIQSRHLLARCYTVS